MATHAINPLEISEDLAVQATRRLVSNILNSYPHTTDVLAESVQNAVDEVSQASYPEGVRATVRVRVDAATNTIEIEDNGRGIPRDKIESLLAPNVSAKIELFSQGKVRGHKGVGLTFLAYGFNSFSLESRTEGGEHYCVTIENGRAWATHSGPFHEAPHLVQVLEDELADGRLASSGTVIRVQPDETSSPKRVANVFGSAALVSAVLETQTAIGQVPFGRSDDSLADFDAWLEYTNTAGTAEEPMALSTTYRFPHERTSASRILDRDAWKELDRTSPAEDEKDQQAVHFWYTPGRITELINEAAAGEVLTSKQELADFVTAKNVHVYALCSYAGLFRDLIADGWGVDRRRRLLLPGLRIATDHMISSWEPREVDMDYRGYINRIWLVYHFANVEPDLGRKNFQPQITDVLRETERRIASDLIQKTKDFLEAVPRGGGEGDAPDEEEPLEVALRRRENPMSPSELPGVGALSFATRPVEEQDVVALFAELIGNKLLACYRLDYVTGVGIYDGYMRYDPAKVHELLATHLPGRTTPAPTPLKGVVEFKHTADRLIEDIVRNKKEWHKIDWLVCWEPGSTARDFMSDRISFTEAADAATRMHAGVTHLAAANSGGDKRIRVLALKDLLDKVR